MVDIFVSLCYLVNNKSVQRERYYDSFNFKTPFTAVCARVLFRGLFAVCSSEFCEGIIILV